MKASDIAYLRQIKGGLVAVNDANKNVIKSSLDNYLDVFKKIKEDTDGVGFNGLKAIEKNQALRLAKTNLLIYKDASDTYIPIEIKNKNRVEIVQSMYENDFFSSAFTYTKKSKDDFKNEIKQKIQDTEGLQKELRAAKQSMTKILNLPTLKEQNEILSSFGIYDLERVLENYNTELNNTYRVTKELNQDDWITDQLTRYIKQDYEKVKKLLMSKASSSEVLSQTKKLILNINNVLDNNSLDEIFLTDKYADKFFSKTIEETLIPKVEIGSINYDPDFHKIKIKQSDAIDVIKKFNLQDEYPITQTQELNIFTPAKSVDELKFGLMDYLSFQQTMKTEYIMERRAMEKENAPILTPYS